MNYSIEQTTKNHDIENIIQQVFKISGVKLTADDPIVAVLVLQKENQSSAFAKLQEETQKLLDSVSEIKKFREQVLIELMNETKRITEQSEEKFNGLLSKHLTEFETSQQKFHKKILTSQIYFAAVTITVVIVGLVLHFIF